MAKITIRLILLCVVFFSLQLTTLAAHSKLAFYDCEQKRNFKYSSICFNSMDNEKKICAYPNHISMTASTDQPFWTGYFKGLVHVTDVELWASSKSQSNSFLKNFDIKIDHQKVCASYLKKTSFVHKTFHCNADTTRLTVQLRGSGIMQLCEVEAYGHKKTLPQPRGKKLSFNKCAQSGLFNGHTRCQKAMNNQKICSYPADMSLTDYVKDAYWTGYFNGLVHVTDVRLWSGRSSATSTVSSPGNERLINFDIKIDNEKVCASDSSDARFVQKIFHCNADTKKLSVQLRGKIRRLELCEVEVYGHEKKSPNSRKNHLGKGGGGRKEVVEHSECVDPYTRRSHKMNSRWVTKHNDFCFHYHCVPTARGPSRVDCLSKNGKCVKATSSGKSFSCQRGTGKCSCLSQNGHTYVQHVRHVYGK